MRINYLFKRLSVVLSFLLISGFAIGQTVSATYSAGAISSDDVGSPTVSDTSNCAATLSVTIPSGAVVTGVDVGYSVLTANGGYMSEGESYIRCLNTGGTAESSLSVGTGSSTGTFVYSRTGLNIANGVNGGGVLNFQMNLFRTWTSSSNPGCDVYNQSVVNNTWIITVSYFIPVAIDASITEVIVANNGAGVQAVSAVLKNLGTTTLTSTTINWSVDGTAQTAYAWTGSLAQYAIDTVNLGNYTFPTGAHSVIANSSAPNAGTDGNTSNDSASYTNTFVGVVNTFPFVEGFATNAYFPLTDAAQSAATLETTGGNPAGSIFLTGNTSSSWGSYGDVTAAFTNTLHIATADALVDATALSYLRFEFDKKQTYTYNPTYSWMRVLINGTDYAKDLAGDSTWNPTTAGGDAFSTLSFDLSAYAGTQFTINIQYVGKYNLANGTGGNGDAVWIDNVIIYEPVANDLQAYALVSPLGAIGMSTTMDIEMSVYNNGTATQSGYTVSYSLDNGTTFVSQIVSTPILAGDYANIVFTTQADLSAAGTNSIILAVSNTGDANVLNDTTTGSYTNIPYPFMDSFETSSDNSTPDYWSVINTSSSTGAYVYADVYSYNARTGTTYLKMYNSSGSSGDLMAVSPEFVSGVAGKVLKFYLDASTAGRELYVGVMTDPTDPSTYTAIDTITGTTAYVQYTVDFLSYTGAAKYMVFSHPQSNNYTNYYIDDIEVYTPVANEMVMLSWDAPLGGIDITSENITVSVYNNGIVAQTNIPVKYSVDGGTTIIADTITATVLPGDTFQFTFSTAATFVSGVNNCGAVVDNGDVVPANDSVFFDVNNYTLPYITGFENDIDEEMPNSWTLLNNTTTGSPYAYAQDYAYYSNTGDFQLKMYNSTAVTGDFISVFPKYGGTTISDKWIQFQARAYGSSIITGVMTDPNDASTFVAVDTVLPTATYGLVTVIFSSYAGTGKYIAFKHGMLTTNDAIYIDDLVFDTAPTGPVYASTMDTLNFAAIRYNFPDTLVKQISISNAGIGTLDVSAIAISGVNAANYSIVNTNTLPMSLAIGDVLTYQVKFFGSVASSTVASIDVTASTVVYSHPAYGDVIDATIDDFPYVENFDDQALDIGWELRGSSFVWQYDNDQTGSSDTGPDADVTGGYYIYTEASSGSAGSIASIYTNPIDFTSLTSPKMNFWYHMYGSTIDTFAIQVATGGTWTLVDTLIGQQHTGVSDPWTMKSIDLSTYTTIDSIRFMVQRGSSYYGDVSLDNIAFGEDFAVSLGNDTISCATPITLDAGAPATGTWMYEWVNLADTSVIGMNQTMTFNSTGTYVLRIVDEGYFGGTDTINVTIHALPMVSLAPLASAYCANDAAVTLVGTPTGGTYSGLGVAAASFDPAVAGMGNHVVMYTITDVNGCMNDAVESTVVNGLPVFDMGMDQTICAGDSAVIEAVLDAGDPYFSEYQEGSSNHKALEIYNGTGATLNLTDYAILTNYNGNAWNGMYTFDAGTTLANGDVFVLANNQSDSIILSVADDSLAYNAGGYVVGFNGDDVRALVKFVPNGDTIIVDLIGLYDLVDPGSGWDVAGVSSATANHTLVRKPNAGPNYGNFAGSQGTDSLSSEWLVYPQNTWNYLGTHTSTIVPPVITYAWNTAETTTDITVMPTVDTYYSVMLTDVATTCYSIDSVEVVVNALPVVNLGVDFDLCANDNITLDAGANFSTYTWSTSASTQTLLLDASLLTMGAQNVSVVVVDTNMCTNSDTVEVTLLALPTVSLGADADVCSNDSLMLDAGTGFSAYAWNTMDTTQTIYANASFFGLGAQEFIAVVTDASMCSNSDTVTLTFLAAPVVNLGADTTILASHGIMLDAGAGFTTYTWSNADMTQTITLVAADYSIGANTYYVDVTDANACAGSDTIIVTVTDDSGISDSEFEAEVSLYPNPNKGHFFLEMNGYSGDVEMEIVTVSGQVVYRENLSVNNSFVKEMNVVLANGMYYVKLVSKDGMKLQKLIVQ